MDTVLVLYKIVAGAVLVAFCCVGGASFICNRRDTRRRALLKKIIGGITILPEADDGDCTWRPVKFFEKAFYGIPFSDYSAYLISDVPSYCNAVSMKDVLLLKWVSKKYVLIEFTYMQENETYIKGIIVYIMKHFVDAEHFFAEDVYGKKRCIVMIEK